MKMEWEMGRIRTLHTYSDPQESNLSAGYRLVNSGSIERGAKVEKQKQGGFG